MGREKTGITPIRLTSAHGSFRGLARIDHIKAGNLEVHWPEGNCLLSRDALDVASGEPDYNALVRVERLEKSLAAAAEKA